MTPVFAAAFAIAVGIAIAAVCVATLRWTGETSRRRRTTRDRRLNSPLPPTRHMRMVKIDTSD
jgi:hypothetical protein